MKETIKRLRSLIAKATTPETIIKRDEACVANTSQLLDYIEKLEAVADAALKVTNECLVSDAEVKDIEKCCYCGHPVTVEGFYDAESGEEWEKVTPIETENEELKQRVKKLEARLADAGTIQTEYCESIDYIEKLEVRIEELISAKGIKELEARLADAEREACAKIADGDKQCEKANCTEQHYCREAIAAAIRARGNE